MHGPAQLYVPSLPAIRAAFTFRPRFQRAARARLQEILSDYVKRARRRLRARDCQLVCVHIRRGDHLIYESINRNNT